jgi:predicted RecB family nuclease
MQKPPLTATDFYKYITCPHWPWFDRFASADEQQLKRALTSGEERRLDDGLSHERDVMKVLFADQSVAELAPTGDSATLFQATLKAMQQGASVIYQGTLIHGDWHGRPDILLRQDGASKLGHWHYVPVDIKTSHEIKVTHRLQLVFYALLLQHVQGLFSEKGAIVNSDKEWIWLELKTFVPEFEDVLAKIEQIRAGEKPPMVLRKACMDTSPWGEACKRQAEAANDIALLYNVDVKKLAALREFGIKTVEDATSAHVQDFVGAAPGLTAHALENAQLQARSLVHKTVFIKEPVALPHAPLEIYFDIESDLPNDVDYLYGFLLHPAGSKETPKYLSFVAERPQDEAAMWASFLAWLETLPPDYVVYHYAPFELTRLKLLESRHGGSAALHTFRDRLCDLKPLATKRITYPLYFYGLKYICKFLGFRWTGVLQSGGESIDWYERWCETGDRDILRQIIQYNEDDVRATLFLKNWLSAYARNITQYESPYPWQKSV